VARKAFNVLGCYDCARVDMRLDSSGNLYILEVNSLPSLGEHGSYVEAAATVGLDFAGLCNRLVEVASARYFGTPSPPDLVKGKRTNGDKTFAYVTERREEIERQVAKWTARRSRTSDAVGIRAAVDEFGGQLKSIGLKRCEEFTDDRVVWAWETGAGIEGGTLLVAHIDVPMEPTVATQPFRRDPEWIYGEGVGSSRAPLVSLLYALRSLRSMRQLQRTPIGVLVYSDEGRDCRYSEKLIRSATSRARNVLVMFPGNPGDHVVTSRRGQRRYRLSVNGEPLRLGRPTKKTEVLRWMFGRLEACAALSSRKDRTAVATVGIETHSLPMLLPHEAAATIFVTYPDDSVAARLERDIRELLKDSKGVKWRLELVSDRAPMKERRSNLRLSRELKAAAEEWDIPLEREGSVWPSVAGLVPASTGVVCGVGPVSRDLYTPHESVDRTSLIQRTLMLAEFLRRQAPARSSKKVKRT
jgi:D-alanine-D-alanine ligase